MSWQAGVFGIIGCFLVMAVGVWLVRKYDLSRYWTMWLVQIIPILCAVVFVVFAVLNEL